MKPKSAFIIAATKSGGGKTTLTLGIMAALVKRGLRIQPYKCGPDFIDPSLHRTVTDRDSYNLDLKMMGELCCRETFTAKAEHADVLVIEGVMGLFDGGEASTAALARCLQVPVFLIIDAQSSAESCAAVLKGFEEFDADLDIAGVIINRIGSPRHRELVDAALTTHCRSRVIGYVKRDEHFVIPHRHLGLHMGEEEPLDRRAMQELAQAVEEQIDLELMLELCRCEPKAASLCSPLRRDDSLPGKVLRLGIALDEAFCFYYPQNFELFRQAGFELVEFSPVHDRKIPESLAMVYFGGGYPENFASALEANRDMRNSIRELFLQGVPIYGECGGFMYLCDSLTDMDGITYHMVGIFPFKTKMNRRLRRLGYRRIKLTRDCLLGREGAELHGHEFHYSDISGDNYTCNNESLTRKLYELDNNSYEGYSVGSAVGSYVHLHFGRTPATLRRLYAQLLCNDGPEG